MVNVTFFEKRNLLLCQLLDNVPTEGATVRIKGEKGQVVSVDKIDDKKVHVEVSFIKDAKKK